MSGRRINVAVEPDGSLRVELAGYEDNSCGAVEDRFRRELARLGLSAEVTGLRWKSAAEREAEVEQSSRPGRSRSEVDDASAS